MFNCSRILNQIAITYKNIEILENFINEINEFPSELELSILHAELNENYELFENLVNFLSSPTLRLLMTLSGKMLIIIGKIKILDNQKIFY